MLDGLLREAKLAAGTPIRSRDAGVGLGRVRAVTDASFTGTVRRDKPCERSADPRAGPWRRLRRRPSVLGPTEFPPAAGADLDRRPGRCARRVVGRYGFGGSRPRRAGGQTKRKKGVGAPPPPHT